MDHNHTVELDIALLRCVGTGDQAALGNFYDHYSKVLFAMAYRIVNDHGLAEDVLQDVFLQIWEHAPLYDPRRGRPLTWAITLTRNKAIDRLRTMQRRNRLEDQVEREAGIFERVDGHTSLDALDLAEKGRLVRRAMKALPREQREAIQLAFFSGLTQVEIAEHFDEPLGTIKARIRRGMMKLRDELDRAL
jgi:RNA polymerase sigma-70 factor, ECF subfamily